MIDDRSSIIDHRSSIIDHRSSIIDLRSSITPCGRGRMPRPHDADYALRRFAAQAHLEPSLGPIPYAVVDDETQRSVPVPESDAHAVEPAFTDHEIVRREPPGIAQRPDRTLDPVDGDQLEHALHPSVGNVHDHHGLRCVAIVVHGSDLVPERLTSLDLDYVEHVVGRLRSRLVRRRSARRRSARRWPSARRASSPSPCWPMGR